MPKKEERLNARARQAGIERLECWWGVLWSGAPADLVAYGVLTADQVAAARSSRSRSKQRITLASGKRGSISKWQRDHWGVAEEHRPAERKDPDEWHRRRQAAHEREMWARTFQEVFGVLE